MLSNGAAHHSLGQAQLAIPFLVWASRLALPMIAGAAIYTSITRKEETTGEPKTFGVDNWRIAYSALAGGIGTAAWLTGSLLPENVRPVATVIGVLGTAAAVSVLFWPSPTAASEQPKGQLPPGSIKPEHQAPSLAPNKLSQILTIFPAKESSEDYWRSTFKDQTYNLIVRNDSDKEIRFYAGLDVYWGDTSESIFKSPPIDPKYGRKEVRVPPHDEVTEILTAPALGSFWQAPLGNAAISFEAFRERDVKDPFVISKAFPVYFYYFG